MKKKIPLSPEEIQNISQLLLSEVTESCELGYELVKQNKDVIPQLLHELMLLSVFSTEKRLLKKLNSFLPHHVGGQEEFKAMKKAWEIFKKMDYTYTYTPQIEELLQAHKAISAEYRPYVVRNRYYSDRCFELGRAFHYRFELEFDFIKECYETAIAGNPLNADAWFNLGYLIQVRFQDDLKSEPYYLECIKLNPEFAAAYNNLGVVQVNVYQNNEEALRYYEKALQLTPHYDFYRCNVASIALKVGDYAHFEKLIQEVFSHSRTYQRALNQWANYLWEFKGDYEEAKKEYLFGLKYYPNDPNLLGNLGEMYEVALHDYNEAYNWYIKSLKQQNSNYRLSTMISLLVLKLKRPEEAIIYYQELLKVREKENCDRPRDFNDLQWSEFLEAEKFLLLEGWVV